MRDIIRSVLDGQGWKYIESDDVFKLDVEGEHSSWSSFIKYDDEDCVSYYAVLPAKADENKLALLTGIFARVNYQLKIGSFEINLSEEEGAQLGQIMLKTYAVVSDSLVNDYREAAEELIRKAIAFNMLTMDYYYDKIMKAVYNEEVNVDEILR